MHLQSRENFSIPKHGTEHMGQKHTGYGTYSDTIIDDLLSLLLRRHSLSSGLVHCPTFSTMLTADFLVWLCGSAF
jgi:hypothetical protein